MAEELCCPRDGRPMDLKWTGKFEKLLLHFCHCGYVHELTPPTPPVNSQKIGR